MTKWQGWAEDSAYGQLFFKRAVGLLPEMESSKAAAKRVVGVLAAGDLLLDVGCGAGHYLRSVDSVATVPFTYLGADATSSYINLAREAFGQRPNASFEVADIFSLRFPNEMADVVMCNNVLLHLPSVRKPLQELLRVTRRHLLIRTLVGEQSFIVQHVDPTDDGVDFDENDRPHSFHYLNIYSENFLRQEFAKSSRVASVSFETDRDFVSTNIGDTAEALPSAWDATKVVNGMQLSGYIVQPWTWISVELKQS